MFIVHYQTNVLYSLQLVIKKIYKCQLEYLFWVMGIMFYEIQRQQETFTNELTLFHISLLVCGKTIFLKTSVQHLQNPA
jgi:hypothetical protein